MLQRMEVIVLRAMDYGESNQILHVLSREYGKIAIMVRGSKRTRSRFGSMTEPFTCAEFVCFMGKEMGTLSEASLINSHHVIRFDLLLTAYGAYWLELVDRLCQEKEPDPVLYTVLTGVLDRLEQRVDPDVLSWIVELQILERAGYRPVFSHCISCRKSEDLSFFSVRQGGLLCNECQWRDKESLTLLGSSIRVLSLLQRVVVSRLGKVELRPKTKAQVQQALQCFMDEHLQVVFKSKGVLQQIRCLGSS